VTWGHVSLKSVCISQEEDKGGESRVITRDTCASVRTKLPYHGGKEPTYSGTPHTPGFGHWGRGLGEPRWCRGNPPLLPCLLLLLLLLLLLAAAAAIATALLSPPAAAAASRCPPQLPSLVEDLFLLLLPPPLLASY
jgi:hypothetical protein